MEELSIKEAFDKLCTEYIFLNRKEKQSNSCIFPP